MSLVVKTGAPLPAGNTMIVDEKVARDARLCIGSEIFVWTAETQGGSGLTALGEVEAIGLADGERRRSITIRLVHRSPSRPLGKDDLAAHDHRVTAGEAYTIAGRLTAKLYVHSLNRVVELTDEEAELLRQRF